MDTLILCVRGSKAICKAIGENPKDITKLVKQGLPAWRRNGRGSWRALPEDLKAWLVLQRNGSLGIKSLKPVARIPSKASGTFTEATF